MNYLVIGGMMTCEAVQHQVRNLKLMLNLYLFLNLSLLSSEVKPTKKESSDF